MANEISRAGDSLLRQILGGVTTSQKGVSESSSPPSFSRSSVMRQNSIIWGERGARMLPKGFPLEQLDHNAPKGTYIDLLI